MTQNTVRNTAEIPRGSKEFEAKLNAAAKAGVQDAIDKENRYAAQQQDRD